MKTIGFLLAGGLFFSVLDPALAQEQCPADPGWLTATTFNESEPDDPLDNDCGFYSQQKDPEHPEDALMEDDMIKAVNEDVAEKFMANSPSDLRRNYKLVGAVWIGKGSPDFKAGVK